MTENWKAKSLVGPYRLEIFFLTEEQSANSTSKCNGLLMAASPERGEGTLDKTPQVERYLRRLLARFL